MSQSSGFVLGDILAIICRWKKKLEVASTTLITSGRPHQLMLCLKSAIHNILKLTQCSNASLNFCNGTELSNHVLSVQNVGAASSDLKSVPAGELKSAPMSSVV